MLFSVYFWVSVVISFLKLHSVDWPAFQGPCCIHVLVINLGLVFPAYVSCYYKSGISISSMCIMLLMTKLKSSYMLKRCFDVCIRALYGPKNHSPACCFLGPAWPVFCLKFLGPAHFRPTKVKARPGPARPVNELNAYYKQFVLCFLVSCVLAVVLAYKMLTVNVI